MSELNTRLQQARQGAGLSQEALSRKVGVSRQAYAAIELGRSVPSTIVALKLARALNTSVEELFQLKKEKAETVEAELLSESEKAEPSRVQLFRVGNRVLARPLTGPQAVLHSVPGADGRVLSRTGKQKVLVELMADILTRNQLAFAGGDLSIPLLGKHLANQGFDLVWLNQDSSLALRSLVEGAVHIAGCHLFDEVTGGYNLPWITRIVPFQCTIITFAVRQLGLMMVPGNPGGIFSVAHLARPNVTFINRNEGSGSRSLLDLLLRKAGIPTQEVKGYDRPVMGHLEVAEAIALGLADVGIGIRAAADAKGLDFLPLAQERYDLVIADHFLDLPAVQAFLSLLGCQECRRQIELLGGYDVAPMGLPISS